MSYPNPFSQKAMWQMANMPLERDVMWRMSSYFLVLPWVA